MIPTVTAVRMTLARHRAELPLLVLGPALGTTAETLWRACADHLTDAFDVLAWDLPGHGHNRPAAAEGFTMGELAAGVLRIVDDVAAERGEPRGAFYYAGDSVGGAVGLQLLLDEPGRMSAAALLCAGARHGTPESWSERIAQVRGSGTAGQVAAASRRWFASGFLEREPDRGPRLLRALQETLDEGYVQVCGALAGFDVRDRLTEVAVPVLGVAGAEDAVIPPELVHTVADGVQRGRYAELAATGHLPPAERPAEVAALLREHFLGEAPATVPDPPTDETYAAGLAVRRELLGDEHVDPTAAAATELTRDFEELVTRYAWGEIWTRPGLDRRSRSIVTLTALVARGHHEELATHLRAARRTGLSVAEIREVLLQTAVYCGVPEARRAFRVAEAVLDEE